MFVQYILYRLKSFKFNIYMSEDLIYVFEKLVFEMKWF